MVKGRDVLEMLIPTGGWTITEDDFFSIIYNEGVKPITKKQFDDGFAKVETLRASEEATKATARQAILDRLGITAEEAAIILG